MVNVAIIGASLAGCVVSKQLAQRATVKIFDKKNKVASCGEWCIKGRIEAAVLSAKKFTDQLLQEL